MFPILTCLGLYYEILGAGLGDLQRLLATPMILRFYYNRCLLSVDKVFLCGIPALAGSPSWRQSWKVGKGAELACL